jgi:hypothetical protein
LIERCAPSGKYPFLKPAMHIPPEHDDADRILANVIHERDRLNVVLALLRRWLTVTMDYSYQQARQPYMSDEDKVRQNAYGRMCRIVLQRFDLDLAVLEMEIASGAAMDAAEGTATNG